RGSSRAPSSSWRSEPARHPSACRCSCRASVTRWRRSPSRRVAERPCPIRPPVSDRDPHRLQRVSLPLLLPQLLPHMLRSLQVPLRALRPLTRATPRLRGRRWAALTLLATALLLAVSLSPSRAQAQAGVQGI